MSTEMYPNQSEISVVISTVSLLLGKPATSTLYKAGCPLDDDHTRPSLCCLLVISDTMGEELRNFSLEFRIFSSFLPTRKAPLFSVSILTARAKVTRF